MHFLPSVWSNVGALIDIKKTTIQIIDGTTPTPNMLTIKVGEGNFTFTENRTIEYILDRGIIDEVREGDEVPVDCSFDFNWEYLAGASGSGALPTPKEALQNTGNASTWISSDSDNCAPYAVDMQVLYEPVCGKSAGIDNERITVSDFRWESLDFDLRESSISVSGRANVKVVTAVRFPQTT
jgi:hypothetical protein